MLAVCLHQNAAPRIAALLAIGSRAQMAPAQPAEAAPVGLDNCQHSSAHLTTTTTTRKIQSHPIASLAAWPGWNWNVHLTARNASGNGQPATWVCDPPKRRTRETSPEASI